MCLLEEVRPSVSERIVYSSLLPIWQRCRTANACRASTRGSVTFERVTELSTAGMEPDDGMWIYWGKELLTGGPQS